MKNEHKNTSFASCVMGVFRLKVIIPLLVILLAGAGAYATIKTAPKAKKRRPVATVPTVKVASFKKGAHAVHVAVMGTVVPAHEVTVEARVPGEVVSVSDKLVPGGFFKQGEELVALDPLDYQLALKEKEAVVANAQYLLRVEEGYQVVAEREWLLPLKGKKTSSLESDLALRKPHLDKAKADLKAANAQLQQAQANLERTTIKAPFAAMVETKSTDVGAKVSTQETLAKLVGTDEFWVQVSMPVDRLDWIKFSKAKGEGGSMATIVSGSNGHAFSRQGRVIRLLPSLESEGRMARVLVSVKDPLNLAGDPARKPLLLGSYVKVYIDGGELADSYSVPRKAFRENNTLWVLNAKGKLEIRNVEPIWRDGDNIYLSKGLEPGESVVLSSISAPVQGMKLMAAGKENKQHVARIAGKNRPHEVGNE